MQSNTNRTHLKKEKWLLTAMIVSMCIWGVSWSSAKVLSNYTSPSALAFLRFLLVPITLIPISFKFNIKLKIIKKGWLYIGAAALCMLCYTLFFFKGLKIGLPGAAGVLITTLNPVFAFLIGLIVSRILPKKHEYIGLIIGIIAGGILLKVWSNTSEIFNIKNSMFLSASFAWALMSKISSKANLFGNAIGFSFWMHVLTVIGLSFFVDFSEIQNLYHTADSKFWLNLLYFGVVNSTLATTCFLYASAKIGAEKASTFIFIVPSMAVLSSWLFLNETILWNTILGGLLGILAVFIINGKFKIKSNS